MPENTESLETQKETIRRKIAEARTNKSSLPMLEQVSREFERETENRAREALGIIVEAMVIEYDILRMEEVLDQLPLPAMLGVLAFKDEKNGVAAINLDMALATNVVDLLMGGDPEATPDLEARTPGEVDRALCMRFIEMLIGGLDSVLRKLCDDKGVGDLHCVDFEHSPLALNIGSNRAEALKFKVNLDIGEAARSGEFELIVPLLLLEDVKHVLREPARGSDTKAAGAWREHMRKSLLKNQMKITAEIDRFEATVFEVSKFHVGQVLSLDPKALEEVTLRMDLGETPFTVATGKLGAMRKSKAIRLNDAVAPALLDTLRHTLSVK